MLLHQRQPTGQKYFGCRRQGSLRLLLTLTFCIWAFTLRPLHSAESAGAEKSASAAEAASNSTAVESKSPGSGNFVVLPLTTELQRRGRRRANARALAVINGEHLTDELDTKINVAAVNLFGLIDALVPHVGDGSRTVAFEVCFPPLSLEQRRSRDAMFKARTSAASNFVRNAFVGFGLEIGFHNAIAYCTYVNDWEANARDLTACLADGAGEDEPGVGDDQVKLYPVRTGLSRHFYGKYDCVIDIIPPLDEADAGIVQTMQRCLPELKLKKKNYVLFLVKVNARPTSPYVDEFCGEYVWKDLLGFKRANVDLW